MNEAPIPEFWQGRITLDKYQFVDFVRVCGIRPYTTDIRAWLIAHDVYVSQDNYSVIGFQIREYYKTNGQMSLLPSAV